MYSMACHPLSQFRLVVKTALKLLLVFVEYSESNAPLLIEAITSVDTKRGTVTRIRHIPFGWTVPFCIFQDDLQKAWLGRK